MSVCHLYIVNCDMDTKYSYKGIYFLTIHVQCNDIYEPPCGKTNNVVSEQVLHKLGCTATEAG